MKRKSKIKVTRRKDKTRLWFEKKIKQVKHAASALRWVFVGAMLMWFVMTIWK